MTSPLLSAERLDAGYNGHPFVRDATIHVSAGEVVALLGPNGAGKSTTLLTLSGAMKPLGGTVALQTARKHGALHVNSRRGLGYVGEDRHVFMRLNVRENLRVGRCDVARVLELFPELERLLDRRAGLLSGGEQQMLAIGRALSRNASVLLVDELSLGLAPIVVQRLLRAIRQAADDGLGIIVVEQHVGQVLAVADRAYVMEGGRIVLDGTASEIAAREAELRAAYLSSGAADAAPPTLSQTKTA